MIITLNMTKNYITIPLLVLGLAGFSGGQGKFPNKYHNYIHPAKIPQEISNDAIYDMKQRVATEAEAEFWKRNYAESERAQRIWEQKSWNSADITDKF